MLVYVYIFYETQLTWFGKRIVKKKIKSIENKKYPRKIFTNLKRLSAKINQII